MHTRQQVYQKVPQFLALVIVGSINKVVKKKEESLSTSGNGAHVLGLLTY
jgi:hypothetical protein